MKIKEIICALEQFAPLPLQDSFDNAGLQVGLIEVEATGVLLCLDVTESIIDEVIMLGYNLIISHHPLIFKELKSISDANYIERCIMKAVYNGITIYAAHTNLDNIPAGVNYKIAQKIGLTNIKILSLHDGNSGSGMVGYLTEPETELDFLKRLKKTFEVYCVRHNKLLGRLIHKVALCGGAGSFLIPEAIKANADVFVTGEIKYHEYFGQENHLLLAEVGHYESEQYTIELLAEFMQCQFPQLDIKQTKINTNPIKYL